jgi:hypothetical protein
MTPRALLDLLAPLPDGATVPVGWLRSQLNGAEPDHAAPEEELLTAEQAAKRLGVTTDWLYRRTGILPFARKLSRRVVRYSAAGLAKYLADRDATG